MVFGHDPDHDDNDDVHDHGNCDAEGCRDDSDDDGGEDGEDDDDHDDQLS